MLLKIEYMRGGGGSLRSRDLWWSQSGPVNSRFKDARCKDVNVSRFQGFKVLEIGAGLDLELALEYIRLKIEYIIKKNYLELALNPICGDNNNAL